MSIGEPPPAHPAPPAPLPGTRHIMEWDDYDAACEAIDRAQIKRLAALTGDTE